MSTTFKIGDQAWRFDPFDPNDKMLDDTVMGTLVDAAGEEWLQLEGQWGWQSVEEDCWAPSPEAALEAARVRLVKGLENITYARECLEEDGQERNTTREGGPARIPGVELINLEDHRPRSPEQVAEARAEMASIMGETMREMLGEMPPERIPPASLRGIFPDVKFHPVPSMDCRTVFYFEAFTPEVFSRLRTEVESMAAPVSRITISYACLKDFRERGDEWGPWLGDVVKHPIMLGDCTIAGIPVEVCEEFKKRIAWVHCEANPYLTVKAEEAP